MRKVSSKINLIKKLLDTQSKRINCLESKIDILDAKLDTTNKRLLEIQNMLLLKLTSKSKNIKIQS